MTQDELKTLVGQAALQYVVPGAILGVGTGSTVNFFLEALQAADHATQMLLATVEAITRYAEDIRLGQDS